MIHEPDACSFCGWAERISPTVNTLGTKGGKQNFEKR
jgi:hypothetical protein